MRTKNERPSTALELMRSRFEAFKKGDANWLMETWHPQTRPDVLNLGDNPQWRGLQIVDIENGKPGQTVGVVEFRATYLVDGRIEILHERSRFEFLDGCWYYVDGQILD